MSLEYGYRINYKTIYQPEIMDAVTVECHEVIRSCVKKDARNGLASYSNIVLIQVENAVHSLEIDDDYTQIIRILEYITDRCSDSIKGNMAV
ncbi:hypothetical protein [Lutispora thermophila]|uniref:Uncharacterized protein n=1 Tax=Lutispora thermophila DSM 19022 TaxID=1122184 RepID=A0A1M6CIW9_9FIRM|nr:hypothetical protein [Lutispora thermophila]SHI60929.1 hypothetical protein SAMN02745176_00801 [Lutispora thermophila DSM 19022]